MVILIRSGEGKADLLGPLIYTGGPSSGAITRLMQSWNHPVGGLRRRRRMHHSAVQILMVVWRSGQQASYCMAAGRY